MFLRALTLSAVTLAASPVQACELALVLAVDVSGSVDPYEYRIQQQGLAEALRDGIVAEALVGTQAQVALLQWTGSSRQEVTVNWTQMRTFDDVTRLADTIADDPRRWRNFSTAIGEALSIAADIIEGGPVCARRVIDVSGDGVSNEGVPPRQLHPRLAALDITVNALAIEGAENDLTGYFYENVIRGEGAFVTTADNFLDYPARIRQKLLREVTRQVAHAPDTDIFTRDSRP